MIVQPRVSALDPEQIAQVHRYSLQILSTVGIRVDSAQARQLFARAAGPAAVHEDRVLIPAGLVEWALDVAPRSIELYNRRGKAAFRLPGRTRFGIGVTTLHFQDPETDQVTPFARRHMASSVRLGGALPSFDAVSTVGVIQDVPPEISDFYAALEMAANTVKPLVLLVSDAAAFPAVLDLLEHLHGDLATRPFLLPYFNPISPLVVNQSTVDKMFAAVSRGVPFIYSNYGMAGASTPISPAGSLALLNAELLAGLVLSQLMKEGTPVMLGSLPAYFDMKGIGSFYDPHSYLIDLACAEMMAHYGLPHCGSSGSGMGWGADLLAASHQWMNHLLSCIGKVGLVPFVGDTLGAIAFSPAIVVYANEIITMARRFAQGFALDDGTVALDEIARAGPGGNFLTSNQTLRLFRTAYYRSEVLPNMTLEEWQAKDCPRAEEQLRQRTRQLLVEAEAPGDQTELLARGEEWIKGRYRPAH